MVPFPAPQWACLRPKSAGVEETADRSQRMDVSARSHLASWALQVRNSSLSCIVITRVQLICTGCYFRVSAVCITRVLGSWVVRVSNWKTRYNIYWRGFEPWVWQGIFFPRIDFHYRLSYSVRISHVYSRMHQHLCARYQSQTLAAVPLFWHTKILHTLIGMGSAALAAAFPYPGKVIRISLKE